MKKIFLKIILPVFLVLSGVTLGACSVPVAGPRMHSLKVINNKSNPCIKLPSSKSRDREDEILLSIDVFDHSQQKSIWKVMLPLSNTVIKDEKCIPYGEVFENSNEIHPAENLVLNRIYSVGADTRSKNTNSRPSRQYSSKFCITSLNPLKISNLNGNEACPVQP